jgi:hypothetical protein
MHKISNKLLMYVGTVAYCIAFTLFTVNRASSSYWAFCFAAFIFMVCTTASVQKHHTDTRRLLAPTSNSRSQICT